MIEMRTYIQLPLKNFLRKMGLLIFKICTCSVSSTIVSYRSKINLLFFARTSESVKVVYSWQSSDCACKAPDLLMNGIRIEDSLVLEKCMNLIKDQFSENYILRIGK